MSSPVAHYEQTYRRAIDVFREKPFVYASLAVELKIGNAALRDALEALVADGMLKVLSERPTLYQVSKFAKE